MRAHLDGCRKEGKKSKRTSPKRNAKVGIERANTDIDAREEVVKASGEEGKVADGADANDAVRVVYSWVSHHWVASIYSRTAKDVLLLGINVVFLSQRRRKVVCKVSRERVLAHPLDRAAASDGRVVTQHPNQVGNLRGRCCQVSVNRPTATYKKGPEPGLQQGEHQHDNRDEQLGTPNQHSSRLQAPLHRDVERSESHRGVGLHKEKFRKSPFVFSPSGVLFDFRGSYCCM